MADKTKPETTEGKQMDSIDDKRVFKHEAKSRTFNQILNDLHKPLPPHLISSRRQGGKEVLYIKWTDAVKMMDYYAPGWSYQVTKIENFGDYLFVIVRVCIAASDGEFFREATGSEKLDKDSYGDPSSNAESMAIRRAFAKFGLAIGLYKPEDGSNHSQGNQQSYQQSSQQRGNRNQPPPNRGNARSGGNGNSSDPTEKMLKFIADLAKKAGESEIDICQEFSDGRVEVFEALTFAECKAAITHLNQ